MDDRTENLSIVRITKDMKEVKIDLVVRESPLTIFLNNQELAFIK